VGSASEPDTRIPAVARIRTLPERHGGVVLMLLGIELALGLGLRLVGVFDPIDSSYQGADAARYEQIAALLYTDHRFAVPGSVSPYDWSPGAPLFYAGVYFLSGGVHVGLARLSIALLGLATIVICYLLGRRLGGSAAGLVAGLLAAAYPAFVFNTGRLLSEPLAEVTVPGAALAFLWAADRRSPWAWLAPGALIGISALARPEYLVFGAVLALLALVRSGLPAAAVLAVAFAAVVAPWAIHVSSEQGRFVPVTTGGGKALFIGSYLPGDGIHDRVKIALMERYKGMRRVTPEQRAAQPMGPLLDRVAARYPHLPRDEALGRIGRANLRGYAREQPVALVRMMLGKMRWMWRGSSGAMLSPAAVALQVLILAFAVAGLALLAWRRRFEAVLLGALILGVTVFSGVVLAAPRRNLALMPIVMALAATAFVPAVLLGREHVRGLAGRLQPASAERS
jgi:4-amino-4-deoxy-L-arabinose transferase-like glycosyltransferase